MCPWHMTDRGHSQAVISGRGKGEGICGMDHCSLRTTTAPPERGRQLLAGAVLSSYFVHFVVVVPLIEPVAGNVAFGAKVNLTPKLCFLLLQPIELTR
jgi:hypothetical protein